MVCAGHAQETASVRSITRGTRASGSPARTVNFPTKLGQSPQRETPLARSELPLNSAGPAAFGSRNGGRDAYWPALWRPSRGVWLSQRWSRRLLAGASGHARITERPTVSSDRTPSNRSRPGQQEKSAVLDVVKGLVFHARGALLSECRRPLAGLQPVGSHTDGTRPDMPALGARSYKSGLANRRDLSRRRQRSGLAPINRVSKGTTRLPPQSNSPPDGVLGVRMHVAVSGGSVQAWRPFGS